MSRCQTHHERKLLEENGSSSKNTKETLLKTVPLQQAFSRSLTQRRTGFSKGPAKLQNGKTMGKYEKTETLLKNGTEYIQDPISMDGTKQSKKKLSQHPNRNISHPWIIRSVGNHVPHDTCEVPGFLPQQEPFGPARWPQLSMFVHVSFMFLRNVRSIPSYSNIFNIFLPSSVFWVLQCKMWKCV